jgi:hypothetical protein
VWGSEPGHHLPPPPPTLLASSPPPLPWTLSSRPPSLPPLPCFALITRGYHRLLIVQNRVFICIMPEGLACIPQFSLATHSIRIPSKQVGAKGSVLPGGKDMDCLGTCLGLGPTCYLTSGTWGSQQAWAPSQTEITRGCRLSHHAYAIKRGETTGFRVHDLELRV